jgi:hypothetical protein
MHAFSMRPTPAAEHIFFSENDPFPRFNGAILSIAQIIKFVMASAAESELAALFVRHGKGNDSPQANSHRYGMATTEDSYPN